MLAEFEKDKISRFAHLSTLRAQPSSHSVTHQATPAATSLLYPLHHSIATTYLPNPNHNPAYGNGLDEGSVASSLSRESCSSPLSTSDPGVDLADQEDMIGMDDDNTSTHSNPISSHSLQTSKNSSADKHSDGAVFPDVHDPRERVGRKVLRKSVGSSAGHDSAVQNRCARKQHVSPLPIGSHLLLFLLCCLFLLE